MNLGSDLSDSQLGATEGFLQGVDTAVTVLDLAVLVVKVFLQLVPLDNNKAMVLTGAVDGIPKLSAFELKVSQLLLD